jgi:ketosteroid isomerase-like protein
MAAQDLEAMVRELRDREMIKELTHQYAHCVRQNDIEGVVNLFAEDGAVEVGPTIIKGQAELRKFYTEELPKLGIPYDFLHNHVIRLQGDRATGVCSLEVKGVAAGKSVTGAGHYDDEFIRAGGEWKFQRRQITLYFFVRHEEGWAGEKFTVGP